MSAEAHQSMAELLSRARAGDQGAREALVSENIALVKFIVKRFMGRGVEYDDLFQYGCIGLLKAIDRFDPGFQAQFSTYAVPVIMGEIRRFLRDDGPIHISRTIRELSKRVDTYIGESEERGHCSVQEIADAVGADKGDVLLALNSRHPMRSLDETVGGENGPLLRDVIGSEPMADVDMRLTLSKLLRDLPAEEKTLLLRRYFKRHTQAQIARDMGTSQVQVSRMESRILKKLRSMAGVECENKQN